MTVLDYFEEYGYNDNTCEIVAEKLANTLRRKTIETRLKYCITPYRRNEFVNLYNINRKQIAYTSLLNKNIRKSINNFYKKYN